MIEVITFTSTLTNTIAGIAMPMTPLERVANAIQAQQAHIQFLKFGHMENKSIQRFSSGAMYHKNYSAQN